MRRFLLALFVLCATLSWAATYTTSEVPDVHRADRREFVANPDGILSPAAVAKLNVMLDSMRRALTVEPIVVAIDNIDDPADPSEFATELFSLWGLGKADKDNGLLILIVKDIHKATIRTGYGLEGVLPDVSCGRIIRNVMAPAFREDNYDAGVLGAVAVIDEIISDPAVAEEYRSSQRDVDEGTDESEDFFGIYVLIACFVAVMMLLSFLLNLAQVRKKSDHWKYKYFLGWKPVFLILTFAGLGIPAIASIPLLLCLNNWRNHARNCPNCGTKMKKVDEVHDNDYLTPAQDLEERLNSVDYDVWLCPNCGETDIIPYILTASPYIECDRCHARTARLVRDRIITRPTGSRPGRGAKEYECLNCRNRQQRLYDIPADPTAALAAGAILGSMAGSGRSGGGFGGGGFSGGGFGGGMTGGGGATGGW